MQRFIQGTVSIFIPVYEGSDLLAELLVTLTNDAYEKRDHRCCDRTSR
jgi:hypothetical protein